MSPAGAKLQGSEHQRSRPPNPNQETNYGQLDIDRGEAELAPINRLSKQRCSNSFPQPFVKTLWASAVAIRRFAVDGNRQTQDRFAGFQTGAIAASLCLHVELQLDRPAGCILGDGDGQFVLGDTFQDMHVFVDNLVLQLSTGRGLNNRCTGLLVLL